MAKPNPYRVRRSMSGKWYVLYREDGIHRGHPQQRGTLIKLSLRDIPAALAFIKRHAAGVFG